MNAPPFKSNAKFLANKHIRLLVKESQAIFMETAEMAPTHVVNVSRRYRSVVHECVLNLSRDIYGRYATECQMFREIEIIWNLCEILMLDIHPTGILITQLTNWIKWHFDDLGAEAKGLLEAADDGKLTSLDEGNTESVFWDLVKRLVLRGELKKAVRLLRCYCQMKPSDLVNTTIELLEKMPLSNQYVLHEFYLKWKQWSDECRRVRDSIEFNENKNIADIIRILAPTDQKYPTEEDYVNVGHLFDNWYQLLVSILLYTDPCVKDHDLSEMCRVSIEIFTKYHPDQSDCTQQFDKILMAAFECDLIEVIRYSCIYLKDNWWFVTHFVDLLHSADQLSRHEINEPARLREFFLIDYAKSLFDHSSLWTIGISYLDNCPINGIHVIEEQLSRIPIEAGDDSKVYKLLAITEKRGLSAVSRSICVIVSRKWIQKGRKLIDRHNRDNVNLDFDYDDELKIAAFDSQYLAMALHWAVAGENTRLCNYIADRFLHHFSRTKEFPDSDMIGNLGPSMLISERLTFLAKYYEFTQILNSDLNGHQLESAASLLVSLVTSKIAPRFFTKVLMSDALMLLERPELVFNIQQTMDLMQTLEDLSKEPLHDCGDTRNGYSQNDGVDSQDLQIMEKVFPKLGHCIARNLVGLEQKV